MIDVLEALRITEEAFPRGPEALADHLGIAVHHTAMVGCDGWCVQNSSVALVRINSRKPPTRQRFTLAHELAHILLGMPPDILHFTPSMPDALNAPEERAASNLAGELLLPMSQLREHTGSLPVDARALRKIAKAAKVSEVMAACRVASLATELGLVNGAVLGFSEDKLKWTWSKTLTVPENNALDILEKTRAASPGSFRHTQDNGEVVVAALVGSPSFTVVFLQLLPPEIGKSKTRGEVLAELEAWLFASDDEFRRRLNGCFGAFKPRVAGMTLVQALAEFNARYLERWTGMRRVKFRSPLGQRYLRLRLGEWCRK